MKATPIEYRFRFWIHLVLFVLGFWAPWDLAWRIDPTGPNAHVWGVLASVLSGTGWLSIIAAFNALLLLAILCAALGAWLRVWGTAYLSYNVVQSQGMHGQAVVADGPYRFVRNPLYLGTWLHTLALALLMPPSGAVFAVLTIGLFQLRLIFAEEPFLAAKLGQPYLDYCARVPRLVPALTPLVPSGGAQPHWAQALLGEIYMLCAAASFAVLGWRYNELLLVRCILISLGISMVVRAVLPRETKSYKEPSADKLTNELLLPREASRRTYYDLLGLDRSATSADIKEAYREFAKRSHPDQNPGDSQAGTRFIEVSEAYQVLSDPQRRASYDSGLR